MLVSKDWPTYEDAVVCDLKTAYTGSVLIPQPWCPRAILTYPCSQHRLMREIRLLRRKSIFWIPKLGKISIASSIPMKMITQSALHAYRGLTVFTVLSFERQLHSCDRQTVV